MRRRSIITVGSGDEEIKIYTIRRKDGYPCFQCAWYALGKRKTKCFASMDAAKLFAQQTLSSCRHEVPPLDEQESIAVHIDAATQRIDRMTEKVATAIVRLTEYRTALITAATTGKIDVRAVEIPDAPSVVAGANAG